VNEHFDFGDGNTIHRAFPSAFYEHPLLYLQAVDDDIRVTFSTTADEDIADGDFLVPAGSTLIIGRPEGSAGMYIHAANFGGQDAGELTVTAGDLRACRLSQYDVIEATLGH
jgi:hypothetical protein